MDDRPTYHGWVWLTGYVLNDRGDAVDKREIFVQQAGTTVLRAAGRARAQAGMTKAANL